MPRTTTRHKITKDFATRLLIRERKKVKINSNLGRALKIAIDSLKSKNIKECPEQQTLQEYKNFLKDLTGIDGPVEKVRAALLEKMIAVNENACLQNYELGKLHQLKSNFEELKALAGHLFLDEFDETAITIRMHSKILTQRYNELRDTHRDSFDKAVKETKKL